ncbi:F0F1-type ATP synthase membrane subunit b/b' [Lachnospiraceae bacterium PF1-22]
MSKPTSIVKLGYSLDTFTLPEIEEIISEKHKEIKNYENKIDILKAEILAYEDFYHRKLENVIHE